MEIRFLNVDLEIQSFESLQPITDDFGEDVRILFQGTGFDSSENF